MQKNDLDEYQAAATNGMEQLPDDHLEFSFPLAVNLLGIAVHSLNMST